MDSSRGPQSHSAEPNQDQHADSPQQSKSRLGPAFHSLSRCSACYNHKKNAKRRWGGGSESSSSAEDSGPGEEVDSDEESSSSSSSVENLAAETPEAAAVHEDTAEPELEGHDVDGHQGTEAAAQGQDDDKQAKGTVRRAPLVKSYSLPASFTPRLIPVSLLPRPPRVVSTLHLQVCSQKQDKDTSFSIRHRLSGNAGGGSLNLLPLQPLQWQRMGLPWQHGSQPTLDQHQLSQPYQQPPSQHFFPQGQRLPPPHPPPTVHPQPRAPAHLNALTPQPCWYCHFMHFPNTHWSHYSCAQLPR